MDKILKRWSLILRLSLNDFKSKYSGSAVGALWAIAEPLATVLIYWFVYTVAVGGGVDDTPYYLWLSVGI
ncbi:MAG: ABC transporter permease, partial [Clostridia bacterium]|nr:ABC transporter permease [Clostridia bacterium]